jgi:hypothetical protein
VSPDVILPVVGGAFGAMMVFFGAYNTARVAKYSNERSATLAEFQAQLKARDDLIVGYKDDVRNLNLRVDNLVLRFDALQQNERMLFWWSRAVYPILKTSGTPFPTPPPGVSDTNPRWNQNV